MLYLVQSITLRELIKLVPFVSGISYHKFEVQDTKGCNIMEKEIWKPVTDWEGIYKVSNLGRVRSLRRTMTTSSLVKIVVPGKVKVLQINKNGYAVALLSQRGVRKDKLCTVHRLVAREFVENPLNKPEVNHKDGNKLNNNVSNLEWVSHSENTKHAADTGLYKRRYGEDNYASVLTNKQREEVRKLKGKKTIN